MYLAAGDETSSNDGSLHRSEVDYSTLAKAEAAAQDSTYSQLTRDSASSGLQRSGPLPTSSDAGHLGQAIELQPQAHYDANGSLEWKVPAQQDTSTASAFGAWSECDDAGELAKQHGTDGAAVAESNEATVTACNALPVLTESDQDMLAMKA